VITGLMPKGSFLYVLERSHIYRFTAKADPGRDGFVFKASDRGCCNHRCWVIVEDVAYLLDERGVHSFTGGDGDEGLSGPVTDIFDGSGGEWKINWQASRNFHAAHDPQAETVRWFVSLSGDFYPRHALCLGYRTGRWWVEEFPFAVTSSCVARVGNRPRCLLGARHGRVYALGGSLDGADPQKGTLRGTATGSALTSLTDSTAAFDTANLGGLPVCITEGRGKGQVRTVTTATATVLNVSQPWNILPDTTSVYQVGGVQWRYRMGWFRLVNDREQETPRRIEVVFYPLDNDATMDMRLRRDRATDFLPQRATLTAERNDGVASTKDEADLVADLTRATGFVQHRFDGYREHHAHGMRFVQWELGGVQGQDTVELAEVVIDGVA
jgi:hypothetical protein